jgi:hypothetical protein
VGENDLALLIKDPQQKLADLEVLDATGNVLKNRGTMTTTDLIVLSFDQKLPDNVELKGYLATPAATVRVPIVLKDIALP